MRVYLYLYTCQEAYRHAMDERNSKHPVEIVGAILCLAQVSKSDTCLIEQSSSFLLSMIHSAHTLSCYKHRHPNVTNKKEETTILSKSLMVNTTPNQQYTNPNSINIRQVSKSLDRLQIQVRYIQWFI